MSLSEIIAVSGQSGLYKTIAQSKNSVIVENLADKKRMPVYATQRVHTLEAISVFCNNEDVPLAQVFKKISEKQNKGAAIDHKADEAEVIKFFSEVMPEYDKERVHISDIRKMIQWYNILQSAGITDFEEKKDEEDKDKVALPGDNAAQKAAPKHQAQKTGAPKPRTHAPTVQKQTVRKTGAA
jgi:hypothetical protein